MQAAVEVNVVDISSLINQASKGITAVVGKTLRGPISDPQLIGSWLQFQRVFGSYTDSSDFSRYCKRALEAGTILKVSRAAHYTDALDKTTITAVKATVTVAGLIFKAANEGTWANGIVCKVSFPASGLTNTVDIKFEGPTGTGSEFNLSYADFPRTFTTADVEKFNIASEFVKLVFAGSTNPIVAVPTVGLSLSGPLASGAYVFNDIVEADIIGTVSGEMGLYSFDKSRDITRIAVPEIRTVTMDTAIATYVDMRKDIRGIISTPIGLNAAGILAYRQRVTPYATGVPIDTWRMSMDTGGLVVSDPVTAITTNISEIGDTLGCRAQKDKNFGEWFAAGGSKRGRIKNALGVVYDLGVASLKASADAVDNAGVNQVINHPDFGPVLWGNSTLQRADTLLKHENVAELVMFVQRALRPLVQDYLFEPNDIPTWKAIYRRVLPLLTFLKDGRAVHDFAYMGDQDIENISEATINKPVDIDAGKYKFIIGLKPIAALKYIYIEVGVTNSGASFEVLTEI